MKTSNMYFKALNALVVSIVTCLSLFGTSAMLQAQEDNFDRCNCPAPYTWNKNLNICVDGTTYAITLVGCDVIFQIPTEKVCALQNAQNRITTIKRICFTAPPTSFCDAATIAKIYSAIECTMVQCNPPGQWGNQMPVVGPATYRWTMLFPRCVQCTAACVFACDDSPCCAVMKQWSVDATGLCRLDATERCTEDGCPQPQPVGSNCMTIDCPAQIAPCCGT